MIDVKALSVAATHIEALPASVTRLTALMTDERWNLTEVEEIVKLDEALTMRLLRAANSAASASAVPIVTVRDAVVRMGAQPLLSLATAVGVQKRLQKALPEYGLSEGELWRHSVAAALAAEALPQFCRASLPGETFAAALLHDVGKLVMARFLDDEILRMLAESREQGGLSSLFAETEVLQVHHGELGGLIAQKWQLPERMVTGIIYHHMPDQTRDVIADAVHVANVSAKLAGTGYTAGEADLEVAPSSLERLGMTREAVLELSSDVASRLEKVMAVYDA
jgi:putative nucleotidyltransferase with HDIG domain